MEKKTKLLAGGAVAALAVAGGLSFALQGGLSNSPKDQFIKRMADLSTVQKAGSKYELSFEELDIEGNPYDSLFKEMKVFGESHTDGKNVDLTVQFSKIFGQKLPQAHFIYANKNVYMNAELIPQLTTFYGNFSGSRGASLMAEDYEGKFIGIKDVLQLTGGSKEVERFNKEMDTALENQTALQKEQQAVLADYLKKVDDKNYSVKDNKITLVLQKDDVKGFIKTALTTMANSKHYNGDKENLKKSLEDFDQNYDKTIGQLDKFKIDITLDKSKRDSQARITLENTSGTSPFKAVVKFNNQEIAYKEPKAPSKSDVLSEKEIDKLIDEIGYKEKPVVPDFKATTN